jgi:hypothetical protein
MKTTIDSLSNQELELYNYTVSLQEMTDMDDIEKKLKEGGIFRQYQRIHKSYLDLFFSTAHEETKLEILKRLIFLNWYAIVEPPWLSGIQDLDRSTVFKSFSILNDYLTNNKIDKEFKWMLSYYSSWDFAMLPFSAGLNALTKFVKEVDTSILHAPKKELPKGTMDNRGQMGMYWISCSVEKD